MKSNTPKLDEIQTKHSYRKYIIAAVIIPLIIIAALVFIWFTQEQKSDPASEVIIHQAVANKLNKEPNDLTDEDYKNVDEFAFSPLGKFDPTLPTEILEFIEFKSQNSKYPHISDIKPLARLVNLKVLYVYDIIPPAKKLPNWLPKLFSKYFSKPRDVSISPLEKLKGLEELHLGGIRIRSLKPLAGLKNLKILCIYNCPVSDIIPLAKLTCLQEIRFSGTQVSDEQIEKLRKKMPNVKINKIIFLRP